MKRMVMKWIREFILDFIRDEVIEPLRKKAKETDNKWDDQLVDDLDARIRRAFDK